MLAGLLVEKAKSKDGMNLKREGIGDLKAQRFPTSASVDQS